MRISPVKLLIEISVIASLVALISVAPNPRYFLAESRDARRLTDLSEMTVAIESYIADFGRPPDMPGVIKYSNLPTVLGNSVEDSSGKGWIGADLSSYTLKLKVDPVNSGQFVYRYTHDNARFKLDAVLEAQTYLMNNSSDGGIDDGHFEVGTGKDLKFNSNQ